MFIEDIAAFFHSLFPGPEMITLHHNPLSTGESVRFQNDSFQFSDEFRNTLQRRKNPEAGVSRNIVFLQEIACEHL